ncbi:MAG: hypothetical protein AAGF97_03145 [Planctomycetota bacterium]
MTEPLISPVALFSFEVPCLYHAPLWSARGAMELPETHRMLSFGELAGAPLFGDLRVGWCETGLSISLRVTGKKQLPWCRASRLEDSDGLWLFVDTRNTQSIHRASRFCHHFAFLPHGTGPKMDQPIAELVAINRAKEGPKPIPKGMLQVRSEKRVDGYLMRAAIPASAMTGFDTTEHTKLGFSYAIVDRELGWQTFSVGSELPFTNDPSLWGTLQLET